MDWKRVRRIVVIGSAAGILLAAGVSSGVAAALQSCSDFNSRLSRGDSALVTSPALNIREAPNTRAAKLRDPLPPGTLVAIVQGPRCVDNFTWWEVAAQGTQGWVAEGNPREYFLSGPVDPDQVGRSNTNVDTSGSANPNPPLSPLNGRPGGGNYEYACRGLSDGLIARDPSTSSNVDSGGYIVYTPYLNMLEVDTPAICLGPSYPLDGSEAAFAPDGSYYNPTITPVYDDSGNLEYTMVQLPLDAFFWFGAWKLEASGYSVDVEVELPDHPYILYTFLDGGQMLAGGMQPNERFILSGTGDDGNTNRSFEGQADGNGTAAFWLADLPWYQDFFALDTNALYSSVTQLDLVGQLGSFVTLDGVAVIDPSDGLEQYRIPIREAAPLMREIFWGGNYDETSAADLLRAWTCPGAAPIRIGQYVNDGNAVVTADAGPQAVYSYPSVNADVQYTVQPGDSTYVLGGVACADNGVWWDVGDGWIMESQDGRYLWTP